MSKNNRAVVIAVASVSGGGKTTFVSKLEETLPNAKAIYFDDYTFNGPESIIDWLDNGADYNAFDLSPLKQDIEVLLKERYNFILLDYPFAYQNAQIRTYIDLALFIDTPLDIAMARRMLRDFHNKTASDILSNLEHYLSYGRKGYTEMLHSIKPNSDVIIDGHLSTMEMVHSLIEKLKSNDLFKY
ncbi:nucleoside/nucleotide kinase family protein [Ornithinibacillus halophilus]|uniref:Uridine kinase n=1 Tax=Ornithinibacillus halophilus TaxID=930117 RepID=A0A1M5KBD0_9BACI|nr:hypothetical protein [Ornithinibacillus halophilus]SHG50037.1 Uridine kinase [Ornithinibacillus halophilus]